MAWGIALNEVNTMWISNKYCEIYAKYNMDWHYFRKELYETKGVALLGASTRCLCVCVFCGNETMEQCGDAVASVTLSSTPRLYNAIDS